MKKKQIVKEFKENGNGEFYLEFTGKELSMFGLEKGDSVAVSYTHLTLPTKRIV